MSPGAVRRREIKHFERSSWLTTRQNEKEQTELIWTVLGDVYPTSRYLHTNLDFEHFKTPETYITFVRFSIPNQTTNILYKSVSRRKRHILDKN